MKRSLTTKLAAMLVLVAMLLCSFPMTVSAEEAADDHLKVLFIGNSYSDDITDGGYFNDSMLYNIMKSMVGDNCKITIGLLWSGGVTMGWHASAAEKGTTMSFFHASDTPNWTFAGGYTTANAMKFTDWDVVVLQPYGLEMTTENSAPVDGMDSKFSKTSVSIPYMLDFVAANAPGAEAYLYLPMLSVQENKTGAGFSDFRTYAKTAVTLSGFKGTSSSLGFSGVIPVGSAVQAARGTYLATFDYNKDKAFGTDFIETTDDPNFGLQRDTVHLSFSVGRYIANLTAAEVLIPESLRLKNYTLPNVRSSAAIGELPTDYRDIAVMAVDAAMESIDSNSKYVSRPISGLAEDPLSVAEKALTAGALKAYAPADGDIAKAIADAAREASGLDIKVDVKLNGTYTAPAEGETTSLSAELTIAHGYSGSKTVSVNVEVSAKAPFVNPFTDVAEGAWYYEGVMFAAENGYMKGTNSAMTLFSPDMQFTREQFVQLLFNMEGLDAADYAGDTGFSDVPAGQWYSAAVKWAKEEGVTNGVGGGVFGLGGKVSREQLAQFLKNYAELKGKDTSARADLSAFTDKADISGWAADAAAWAVSESILGSTQAGGFVLSPQRVAIRSEIAKVTLFFDMYLNK